MTAHPGDPDAVTATPPTIEQHVEPDVHTVVVDLTPAAADQLRQVARVFRYDDALLAELRILGTSQSRIRQAVALKALLDNEQIRDALTITLTASDAERLGDQLLDASREPHRCADHDCPTGSFADPTHPAGLCAPCAARSDEAADALSDVTSRRTA